jgi:signal transduction histidine kinase
MDKLTTQVHKKFAATILMVVLVITLTNWLIIQVYNNKRISAPAKISEVNRAGTDNPEFADYLVSQKEYEAHFISVANEIKRQESNRVTRVLAVSTASLVIIGAFISLIVSRRLMKPVKEAYQSQERFIQDAAHELRNPLAAMTAALQQPIKHDSNIEMINTFKRQTKRLININEDLLFLERRTKQSAQNINISDLLLDVVEELQPLARRRKIILDTTGVKPGIFKLIPSSSYVRVAKNLIDNAIKYSPDNSKIIIGQTKIKSDIVLTIADSGIGIPNVDKSHIGERFFRASNTGEIEGTGLGIAIVTKILNLHRGSFTLVPNSKKGTIVTVRMPT